MLTLGIAERCSKIYSSDELMDMAENFETIRTMLFGDKIDYTQLLKMLQENVDECGWTEKKAAQKREENREKLEEKRKKYEGRFSAEMPERLKKQLEGMKKSEGITSEGGDDNG